MLQNWSCAAIVIGAFWVKTLCLESIGMDHVISETMLKRDNV